MADEKADGTPSAAAAAAATAPKATPTLRAIARTIKARETVEGAGVTVFRSLGFDDSARCDPFLLLDEMKATARRSSPGFPTHPHRGFCTCTIMLSGELEHKDSTGNSGKVGPGGVQFMSAGRGVLHSEMPTESEGGDMHGLQLWINLPAKEKMTKPRYQDIQADTIPVVESMPHKTTVRVIVGETGGKRGPLRRQQGLLAMLEIESGGEWRQAVAPEWSVFVYVVRGAGAKIGDSECAVQSCCVLSDAGDEVAIAAGPKGVTCLVAAAPPINEPIVQRGPFVMNTDAEVEQAFKDMRSGKLAPSRKTGGKGSAAGAAGVEGKGKQWR